MSNRPEDLNDDELRALSDGEYIEMRELEDPSLTLLLVSIITEVQRRFQIAA